jgi:hypothetical protein
MLSPEKAFYEKLSKKELSDKEVFEAKSNFVGFFDLLYCIDTLSGKKKIESDTK